MSFLKMCVPADGVKGIKQFVLESIVGAGGKPCPPGIVGVGIGGSADYAMYLAKEAIARPVGTRNPDPIVAQLEDELYGLLNETGIGPMGLGGDVTVLQCHIEHADTHMTLNPVAVNYQCGAARRASAHLSAPGVRKLEDGRYEKVCIGTTTSARMVRFTEPLGTQYGVRAICGKGGFPDDAIEPMRKLGMVYFAIVGGAAALETTQIEEIEEVAWEELMPECLWKFRVKDFGPLTVGIDAHGNSLYHDVQSAAHEKLKELYARL